ncbi:hypothetical protein HDU96_008874 [Phlyctochytrium bullatum]|nr:hypothetical protein HDU96_008874 [Phlyctochytrium bullatum]
MASYTTLLASAATGIGIAIVLFAVVNWQLRSQRVARGLKNLKDKVVLVTGASKGIGVKIAEHYARHNAVLVLAARTVSKLEEVAAHCRTLGSPNVFVVPFDARDDDSCRRMVAKAVELTGRGRLDVVVLNHTMSVYRPLFEMAPEERLGVVKEMVQSNYIGYVATALEALPYLEAPASNGSAGSLVVVSSLAAKIPTPNVHAYSASKHAIDGFFNALRLELKAKARSEAGKPERERSREVKVTMCLLGAIKTESFLESTPKHLHAMAEDPGVTAKVIVEKAAEGAKEFFFPSYISIVPLINQFSRGLGEAIVNSANP